MTRPLPMILSLVVPGLGSLVRGAWLDAALWLFAAFWIHVLLAATGALVGPSVEPLDAALWGLFAHPPGRRFPLVIVLSALALALHLAAAWDVGRRRMRL